MASAAALTERAALVLRGLPVPDHSDACISALALAIIEIAGSSPDDQAEQVALIARMMRRG